MQIPAFLAKIENFHNTLINAAARALLLTPFIELAARKNFVALTGINAPRRGLYQWRKTVRSFPSPSRNVHFKGQFLRRDYMSRLSEWGSCTANSVLSRCVLRTFFMTQLRLPVTIVAKRLKRWARERLLRRFALCGCEDYIAYSCPRRSSSWRIWGAQRRALHLLF